MAVFVRVVGIVNEIGFFFFYKNDIIWCVLVCSLILFCFKNVYFLSKK